MALSSRLMRVCCSSASSARTCSPAGSGRTSTRTECARAVGSISRATAPITGSRSTTSPCDRWPRDMRRKCWVIPRQRRICSRAIEALSRIRIGRDSVSRAGFLRRRSARSRAACSVRGRSRRRVCRATPAGAIRPGALRRRAARKYRATPPPPAASWPEASRIGEAWTSSQTTVPSGVRRSQMRTCRAPDCEAGQRRAVIDRAAARRELAAPAAEHVLSRVLRAHAGTHRWRR